MIPDGKRAYNNAPKSVQKCEDFSFTIVEIGVTSKFPKVITVPYDIIFRSKL